MILAFHTLPVAHTILGTINFSNSLVPVKSEEDERRAEEYKNKGNQFFKDKNFAEAANAYTTAIQLNNKNATYWSNRSSTYLALKLPNLALQDAEICRRLNPDWPKGCYRLAAARLALTHYEDAAVAAFEGCKLDNNNKELKEILQKAVKLGREEHEAKQNRT
jgi:tetratricopeptide (TPR) repeat protein